MKRETALRVLSDIMGWDDSHATKEFRWLSLIARLKYDGYQDFLAGVRFLESLAKWIQQFERRDEREQAYTFVRQILVYVGPLEMQRLVELFFPDTVQRNLLRAVAAKYGIPSYRVWATLATAQGYDSLLRRTLFVGLSEGAHLDIFRRANAAINNEQVLLATHVDQEKWDTLLEDLRADLGEANATFSFVYLIDDFTGSGTTFIRNRGGEWKGKLARFYSNITPYLKSHFDPEFKLYVHHYIASHRAAEELPARQAAALSEVGAAEWFRDVEFSFGTVLPATLPIDRSPEKAAQSFLPLAKEYCDREDKLLKNRHFEEGTTTEPALGFANGALPLVLEHNTPNNSVALLWAETEGASTSAGEPRRHAMRPLFRRRQRHS